jgi:hypothetical protein
MQLARVMLGLSYSATGRLFDSDRTTARMPAGWLRITGTIRPSTAYCSREGFAVARDAGINCRCSHEPASRAAVVLGPCRTRPGRQLIAFVAGT